jgi:hypothetical protein
MKNSSFLNYLKSFFLKLGLVFDLNTKTQYVV